MQQKHKKKSCLSCVTGTANAANTARYSVATNNTNTANAFIAADIAGASNIAANAAGTFTIRKVSRASISNS